MKLISAILPALAATAFAAETHNAGFANCDFESGPTGWGVWYSDDRNAIMTRYPWSVDGTVAHGGRQSLKIVAPDEDGCAFVNRASSGMKPGARYEVSYWFRKTADLDEKAFRVQFNFRPANPAKADWKMKSTQMLPSRRKSEGEWQYRAGVVLTPKDASGTASLGLYLKGARGTIWIDDVQVREVKAGEDPIADLWVYDPNRVELGSAPLKKFNTLKGSNDPTLARAARYNETLVHSAFVKENVRRCLRIRHWVAEMGAEADQLTAGIRQAEEELARLYRAYGEAFIDGKNSAKIENFERQATTLQSRLEALDGEALRFIAATTDRCRAAGRRWGPPPAPLPAALPAILPDGRVNQIIYGNRSSTEFQALEKPLGFDPVHSTSVGGPRSDQPGQYDWSAYDKQWDDIRASGIPRKSCLLLFAALHDGTWAPKWLLDQAKSDPEILHVVQPAAPLSKRTTGAAQLNWWHPAVRDYGRELVTSMGRAFRSRDEFLFYEYQWEAYGPYVGTDQGTREVGYGRHAEASFRTWLKKKYGSIAALNRRWGAAYAGFDDIAPPPDRHVVERRRTEPLAAEWEAWREESYEDWCRLLYRAWKQADPTKPVFADNSSLFRTFNMPNIADTCDLIGFHNSGPTFMPTVMLLNSISRHNGYKPLAQYENFWGVQEDHDRMQEELARRHGTQKHIFRMTAWNLFLQIWWYSYTSAPYLTHYDGNYFDPAYALTTLRYRTAALPVYFQKFKRLQRPLLDSRIVTPRLGVLAPTASMRNAFPYGTPQSEVTSLFWELFPRNDLFDLVHEEYFLDGRAHLDDFDALVLPYALYLDERLQTMIAKWLKAKPRLLVSVGPFGLYDEIGRDSGTLLKAAFPGGTPKLEVAGTKGWTWGEGSVLEGRVGPSPVIALAKPVRQFKTAPGAMDGLVKQIESVALRHACDDGNVFEMVLRQQGRVHYLCVLNPNQDDAAAGTVRVKGAFKSVTDLDYERGFPVPARVESGHTVFPLRLEPGEATLIQLAP